VSVKDFGAVGDGVTDDTAAIQAAIDASTHVVLPSGDVYVISSALLLPSNFTLEVNGNLLLAPNSPDDTTMIKNSDRVNRQNNIHITGTGRILGNKANQQTGVQIRHTCIDFYKVDACTITVAEIGSNKWDNAYPLSPASGIRACVEIDDARYCKIDGVLLYEWEHEGLNIDPNGGFCVSNTISNCICEGSGAASYSGVQVGGVGATHNIVNNIIVKNCGASGVGIDTAYSSVSNITVYRNGYSHGVNFGHTGSGADYTSASNISVQDAGNLASTGNHFGINVGGGTTHLTLTNVSINTTFSHGINISDSANNVVIHNAKIVDAGGYGFNIFSADDCKLIGCYAVNSTSGVINIGGTTTGTEYILGEDASLVNLKVTGVLTPTDIDLPSSGGMFVDTVARFLNSTGSANWGLRPASDNTAKLGYTSARWTEVYAVAGSINTSDQKQKQQIQNLSQAELNVATALKGLIKKYKWNDAVDAKGENARIHVGVIAQDVEAAFAAEGLDARSYGVFCADTIYVDADGNLYDQDGEDRIAEERLGVRYSQLFAFIIAAL